MQQIEVRTEIRAPLTRVFDAISDHEKFFRGHGVKRCVVSTPGKPDRNGLGSIREIDAAAFQFREEVVRFNRPERFDYVIRSVKIGKRNLPMEHELGWLEFSERGGVTEVVWRSRFRMAIPLIGGLVGRVMRPRAESAFRALLQQAKKELESNGAMAGASAGP